MSSGNSGCRSWGRRRKRSSRYTRTWSGSPIGGTSRQTLAAAPLKPMPLIVLSADEPLDLLPFVEDGTLPLTADEAEEFGKLLFQAFVDARADLVSQVPGARHITDTDSGHYVHQEQPRLVIDSVREVVNAARKKSCALGVKNHGQCVKAENHARR